MNKIKLKRGLYEGKDVGYSQFFGGNREWYAKFGLSGHNGIDIPVKTGTNLLSCIDGTVTEVAFDRTGYGNYIKIENDTCGILYGHMRELTSLKVGETVKAGVKIGVSGNTGNSTGDHTHFGVFPKPRNRDNGYAGYIDPFDKKLIEWVDEYEQGTSTDTLAELRKALEEMTANKDEWKTKAKDLEVEVKELKKDIKTKDTDFQNLKTICETLEQKRNEIAIENDKLNKEVETVNSELKMSYDLNCDLTATIITLRSNSKECPKDKVLNYLKNLYEQISNIKLR